MEMTSLSPKPRSMAFAFPNLARDLGAHVALHELRPGMAALHEIRPGMAALHEIRPGMAILHEL
jgi:hypothetical protein